MAFLQGLLPVLGAAPLEARPPVRFVTGAFVQLNPENSQHDSQQWQAELAAMRAIGMDVLVVQYVASDRRYYYPTKLPDATPSTVDAIQYLLDAADANELDVFLGLQLNTSFWRGKVELEERLARNRSTLNELYSRYGKSPALAGWYIPEEIDDHTSGKPHAAALLEYVAAITAEARRLSGWPTMISPFFGQQPDAAAYARWWDEVALPKIKIDILALQDGVGTHRTTIEESREVFAALAPVMDRHGVAFWANNESFDQIHGWPVDDGKWAARPTEGAVFRRQVAATAPYVERAISFEFHHYLNPTGPLRARQLYQDCREHYLQQTEQPTSAAQAREGTWN